jgi:osmotically-inducible protein OsmY
MLDQELRQNVIDALTCHPGIDAANIGVAVKEGVVTLTGYVPTYWQKTSTEAMVARVKGVRGIAEEIEVRFFGAPATSDEEIARRALNSIDWNASLPKDAIQVKVDRGLVTLSGSVNWHYQKELAADSIRGLSGLVGLINKIEVVPTVSPANVKWQIEEAFKRDAELDAKAIRVNVSDGKVTLEGKVKAWSERNAAERAAWSSPGVRQVEDRISVI